MEEEDHMAEESSVRTCMAYFCRHHKVGLSAPYMPSYGKDQAILKVIIGTYGVEKTMRLIEEFFRELKTDTFLQKTGASIGIFKTQIPKLLMKSNDNIEQGQIGVL
jgi:hypothetical protein